MNGRSPPVSVATAPRTASAAAGTHARRTLAARWHRLPRDARDTLFLVGVIAWTIAPHAQNLPAWCLALAAAMLAWRSGLAVGSRPLPSRWLIAGVLVVAAGLTFFGERTLLGKEAGVTMLVVLMTLKTLELRARRDALVVFFLGFFLVLTHFLYSQSLLVALSMVVSTWGLLTALVLAHMPVGRPPLARAAGLAARAALLGAPVMVALFLFFPRVAPLWGIPQDAAGRTGLSGTLRMGGVAEVANDDTIAMRVRFFGTPPPPQALYWRGPVLSRFDGVEWRRGQPSFPPSQVPRAELTLSGQALRYEATLEPSRLPFLPLLEMTPDRPDAAPRPEGFTATLRSDLQWQLDRPLAERVRFEAAAWLLHRHGPRAEMLGLRDEVRLPAGFNPRTLAFAAEWRARPEFATADAATLTRALLRHFATQGFAYTLEPGLYGRDAVDEFLFDRRLGFCEHFAAAFVVLMRAMDVPARIVTGYQGADPLPVDGYWIVRNSHAHAWAEVWQAGVGWQRVDPTAAVAPDRVQQSRQLLPEPGFVAGAFGNVDPRLAAQWREFWETVNNRWNQWVLNYSRTQQFDLLRSLGLKQPQWADLGYALAALLGLAAGAGAAWSLWDRWRLDPWWRLAERVRSKLAAIGVPVAPHDPPRRRAMVVRQRLGERGEALAAELEWLDHHRYANPGRAPLPRRWWRGFERAAAGVRAGG
jgi:transglutaminase-like putative cysteine protease